MSNGAPTYNLSINQYATLSLVFTWSTGNCPGAVGAALTPVDLTGYSATLQIRQSAGGTLLYDASSNLTLGGVAGTITITIPGTTTAGFTWFNGAYDLLMTSAGGVSTRLLKGNVTVSLGVST